MLCITDSCQVQMRLTRFCNIRQGESCLCRILSAQERRQCQATCRQQRYLYAPNLGCQVTYLAAFNVQLQKYKNPREG